MAPRSAHPAIAGPTFVVRSLSAASRALAGLAVSLQTRRGSAWPASRRRGSRPGGFVGTRTDRLYSGFRAGIWSPDQEIGPAMRMLRARARWLVRNNGYASGFVNDVAVNVVGPEGIRLQAKVGTRTGALNHRTNREIERGWKEWSHPETASADGIDGWVDLQSLMIRTIATDGEVFVRRLRYFDNEFGYALQLVDADQVDETYTRRPAPGVNEIRMGVEVNGFGRPLAYWVWSEHPSEPRKRTRERIPADEMLHLFVRYRPNQTRGITWFAPVLLNVEMFDGLTEAELVRARVSASKMGFIVNKTKEAIEAWEPPEDAVDEEGNYIPRELEAEAGVIPELYPGQEFQSFDPSNPSPVFKAFSDVILRGVARGLHTSHASLTGDLSGANYSSLRAGQLPERDAWRMLQGWFTRRGCRPVYRDWIAMALLAGAVRVDSRLASNYYEVEWKPRGWRSVDPLKDRQADALGVALGVESRQQIAAAEGKDWEEVVDELAHEAEYADAAGVSITPPVPGGVAAPDDPAAGSGSATPSDSE